MSNDWIACLWYDLYEFVGSGDGSSCGGDYDKVVILDLDLMLMFMIFVVVIIAVIVIAIVYSFF